MNKSGIQWLDGGYTWNPIKMRCARVSDGCKNCWHLRMAKRHAGNHTFSAGRRSAYSGHGPVLDEREMGAPSRVKKPSKIALQLMGDVFHESIADEWLSVIFAQMYNAHHHTFMVLTKRPERMRQWMEWYWNGGNNTLAIDNIWLGVSVENQKTADKRIPILLQTPASVRWISAEPLLEAVDIEEPGIDLCVVGGESGPGARPFDIAWARSIRDQCKSAGTAFYMKQVGERPNDCGNPAGIDRIEDRSGGDPSKWPADLRVRELPFGGQS